MFWLARPPYLRWALAAVVAVVGVAIELAPEREVEHPFAVEDLAAGERVDAAGVEWRSVPEGLLPPVSLPSEVDRPIRAGEPVLPSSLDSGPDVPKDWWALELPAPDGAAPGRSVQVVVAPDGPGGPILQVPGVVVSVAEGDGFSPPPALVAVPPDAAAAVAVAASETRVTVMLGSG